MPKISVIVPVYKAEKYLNRCVDSILNQTFKDFELILVDDGSPDNSPKMCDEYALKDSRIHVIHKENGGVSTARNMGIDNANGEYICFVDSDDFTEQDYLQTFIDNLNNVDGVLVSTDNIFHQYQDKIININKDFSFDESKSFYAPWNFIYSREKIIKNKIYFKKDVAFAEDAIFNFEYLTYCKKIKACSKQVYHYTVNTEGATYKTHAKMNEYLMQRFVSYKKFINSTKLDGEKKLQYIALYTFFTYYNITSYYCEHFKMKEAVKVLSLTKKILQDELDLLLKLLKSNKNVMAVSKTDYKLKVKIAKYNSLRLYFFLRYKVFHRVKYLIRKIVIFILGEKKYNKLRHKDI